MQSGLHWTRKKTKFRMKLGKIKRKTFKNLKQNQAHYKHVFFVVGLNLKVVTG